VDDGDPYYQGAAALANPCRASWSRMVVNGEVAVGQPSGIALPDFRH